MFFAVRLPSVIVFFGVEEGGAHIQHLEQIIFPRIRVDGHNDGPPIAWQRVQTNEVYRSRDVLGIGINSRNKTFGNMVGPLFAEDMVGYSGNDKLLNNRRIGSMVGNGGKRGGGTITAGVAVRGRNDGAVLGGCAVAGCQLC